MKKVILLFTVVLLSSCASKNIIKEKESSLNGNWFLNKVTNSKSGQYNVTFLNELSQYCIQGSTWKFTNENNSGSFAINKTKCKTAINNFTFSIQSVDQEQKAFDMLIEREVNGEKNSFRYTLKVLDENNLQLQKKIVIDNTPLFVYLNFNRLK
ncbi:hypothetical protein N9V96_01085 [Polaribacter sp.]|nr:hypothetical protein [Polaribacter sp.]